MQKYDHKKIESKWQQRWEDSDLYKADDNSKLEKKYILDMFPYPSGAGLHIGHVEGYTATDIYSRFLRMQGKYNVLHPMGWDAFGLPAENYAIKTGTHPDKSTHDNIKNFTKQLKTLGLSFDWSREIDSSSPEYYKWTQWFFLLLYKNGLAYKKKAQVNWCNSCNTVLANEQAEGGKCERCESEVVQKDLSQWFFKITDFVDDQNVDGKLIKGLLNGLDDIDWPESTKTAQKNWIGRSEGAKVKFKIRSEKKEIKGKEDIIAVFTTRPDTLFGATYFVVAPEHPVINNYKLIINNYKEVEKYVESAKKKTELERTDLAKDKTGIKLEGIVAINPVNNEEIPVYTADYVLSTYGTGAIMAVPAHDERDFEFAKKYDLEIKNVVAPYFEADKSWKDAVREDVPVKEREIVYGLVKNPKNNSFLMLEWPDYKTSTFVVGGVEKGEDLLEAARREILEETGYKNLKFISQLGDEVHVSYYALHKNENRYAKAKCFYFELIDEERDDVSKEEKAKHKAVWVKEKDVEEKIKYNNFLHFWNIRLNDVNVTAEYGIAFNSGFLDGLKTVLAKEKMIEWLEEKDLGKKEVNFRLRDWLISRQRYWGSPIPIIHCDVCGEVPVPIKDLPVDLPTDVDFKPTGESPLNNSKTFHDVKCPKCGLNARRESDTMDTFVCSSWYYLRFADSKNEEEFASKEKLGKWLPVDTYVGGAEHTVLHLLYSRFFTKVLQKYNYVDFNEPFTKLRHQGLIMAEDGNKMSKSKGNVVNPDIVIDEYGADTLRMYEMFMGPLEDMKPWNTKGIVGIKRFLERIFDYINKDYFGCFIDDEDRKRWLADLDNIPSPKEIEVVLNKTIKKVTEDINEFKFNTAISQMMIFLNSIYAFKNSEAAIAEGGRRINRKDFEKFLIILSPFAPHIAEEIWEKLGNKKSVFKAQWPKHDSELIKEDVFKLVVQVNGKLRDTFEVRADISEEEALKSSRESEKIKKWLKGKTIVKEIFIKGKLVNIVVK